MRNMSRQILVLIIAVFLIQPVFGMYHQKMGRFMTHDPLGVKPDKYSMQSQFMPRLQYIDGVNVYEYVISNPVRFVDAYGLSSCCTSETVYKGFTGWLAGLLGGGIGKIGFGVCPYIGVDVYIKTTSCPGKRLKVTPFVVPAFKTIPYGGLFCPIRAIILPGGPPPGWV